MKNTPKFFKIVTIAALSIFVLTMVSPTSAAYAETGSSTQLSDQDILKMSAAIDMSTDSEVYDVGTNPYRIFDVNNEDFAKLFVSANNTDFATYAFSASSRAEFSSTYGRERSFGLGVDVGVPVYDVSANVDANFKTNISEQLATTNDERYEYYERYQQTRTITTNWRSRDLTDYFDPAFVAEYLNIDSPDSARAFLEKYGTHVFDRYYMGGSLIITNYIASETNIVEEYESENKSIDLNAHITDAINASASGSDGRLEGNNVSNEHTKSQMNMRARGGMNLDALTVDDLFTYNRDFASEHGSGYVYRAWIASFDSVQSVNARQNEVVIKTDHPVAVWELLHGTKYFDQAKDEFLQQAFEIMCYANYSRLCVENEISSDIIGNVEYTANNVDVKFTITDDEISLPSGISAKFNWGGNVLNNENIAATIELDKRYEYATIDKGVLTLSPSAAGEIYLVVKISGAEIYKLKITVSDYHSGYTNGYGTKDQPYLISDVEEWNSFIRGELGPVGKKYYQLVNDIDLQGANYNVGGSSSAAFNGELDGNGHVLSNFTVIAEDRQNIGLFGSNVGVIKNLTVENARCMNSEIIAATDTEINAGILVGENLGKLENIVVRNSAVRVTGQVEGSAMLNVGAVCGMSYGSLESVGVSDCNVYGQSWKGSGVVNVGGLVGAVKVSNVTRCYVNNSKINAFNQKSESATYRLGGLVGYVYSTEDVTAKVSSCIANDVAFNTTDGDFGYIAGASVAKNSFVKCYYEALNEKSVGGKTMSGCTFLRELTLEKIGDAEFNMYWTDSDGYVVLKIHVEGK